MAWPGMPLIPANPTGKIIRRPRAGCARHAAASCRPPLAARSPAQAPSPFRSSAFLTFWMGVRRPLSAGPQTMRFKAVARPLNLATIPGSTQSTTGPSPIVDWESSIGRAPNRHIPQRLPLRQQERPKQRAPPRARIPTADSDRAAPAGGRGAQDPPVLAALPRTARSESAAPPTVDWEPPTGRTRPRAARRPRIRARPPLPVRRRLWMGAVHGSGRRRSKGADGDGQCGRLCRSSRGCE